MTIIEIEIVTIGRKEKEEMVINKNIIERRITMVGMKSIRGRRRKEKKTEMILMNDLRENIIKERKRGKCKKNQ